MDAYSREGTPNPREKANPLSVLLFWWTVDLFRKGYKKDLAVEDLYSPLKQDCSKVLGDNLERQWEREVERAKKKGKNPSLGTALVRTYAWEFSKRGILLLANDLIVRLSQPLLLGQLLAYFKPSSTMERSDALFYAGGIVLFMAFGALLYNHYLFASFHTGVRIRAACCSLIYRKSLRLSQSALGETAAGQVVNLLSNDVSRFEIVLFVVQYVWTSPILTIIVAYLMWAEIGWPCFMGLLALFVVVPLQAYTGKLSAVYRNKTAFKTDKRIRLMDEIISGIQVIKMYAWEKPFSKLIVLARRAEIAAVTKTSYIRGIYMMFALFMPRIAVFCTLITMVFAERPMTVDKVFIVLAYFNLISQTMGQMFVRGISEVAESLVSVRRLETFMHHDEVYSSQSASDGKSLSNGPAANLEKKDDMMVVLKKATAKWTPDNTDDTLSEIDLEVPRGKLVIVTGQVGAGKSSLLNVILRELPLVSGSCTVNGKVSYASQEPWVFAATVRQNIIFGREFDRLRYNRVVRACALKRDFKQFPNGDMTVVGERGSSLSGGQKARISLARAVYNDADIYLLDDPLSAVDVHVGKHLLEECFNDYLLGKTRILVTHQLQFLSEADHIVILNNGKVEMQGSFQELSSKINYAQLISDDDAESVGGSSDGRLTPIHSLLRQISSQSKSLEHLTKEPQTTGNMLEASSKGKAGEKSLFLEYFRSGTNYFVTFLVAMMMVMAQGAASGADYFISYWISKEELRNLVLSNSNATDTNITTTTESDLEILPVNTYVYIYSAIIASLFVLALTRSFIFYKVCMKCSEQLHHLMFRSVIRTRMRFFDTNPSGRILNRFSKDIGSADELLPKAILDASQMIMMMAGSIVLAVIVNYLFLIPLLFLAAVFLLIQRVYLKTSRNTKRLDGITKSPVFTHLHATLQGLTTIRAYGAQGILRDEFDKHQDLHTASTFMSISAGSAFGFSLDVLTWMFITCVTFSFLFLEDSLGGFVGLIITQIMALTMFMQWGMRQSAEIANQMTAVERILEYARLEEEPNLESPPAKKPPSNWPSLGNIEFAHVFLKYSPTDEPVLKNLSISVKSAEKVGIVGRTGAGKSSLIAAMFRLAWVDGKLMIDGVDTKDIALQALRSKISIIPQDPVLFSGTMRKNLDPFDEYPDSKLWEALQEVELKDALHEDYGLQTRVAEGGCNFSVGQRQLVCLARALIRNNKILMLDEATANVDPHTDSLIQTTIRDKFRECTVLTVAHRLNTIMDSDKVLVMDSGRMVEFDHPHILLQNSEGYFYKMVQETGKHMVEQLTKIAQESYESQIS
ncbi:probable multidrug resistance-associated protein lethal(2)03659 [Anabrus simplex]|uniref:probable multidrug resistance-associated protein lethal(2)03659 n=1 Tax=Anabrus simplex TaxID=316456 RepID=UPI0035A3AED7